MSADLPPLGAVFDCMVFLQGAARATSPAAECLGLIEGGTVQLVLSDDIITEVRDVLTRPKLRRKFTILTPEYVDSFLGALLQKAVVLSDVPWKVVLLRDPKDEPYINLTIASGASYLVSRDHHLLDLMLDPAFCLEFPNLAIVDPEEFLHVERERRAAPTEITGFLRMLYGVEPQTRIDVVLTSEGSYKATIVNSGDEVQRTIDGYFKRSAGRFIMAPMEQPDLTLEQLHLYDTIVRDFNDKLNSGAERGLKSIQLVEDGEYPELFGPLGDQRNVNGNVKPEMLAVWQSLDFMLRERGYRLKKMLKNDRHPAALYAERRKSRLPI